MNRSVVVVFSIVSLLLCQQTNAIWLTDIVSSHGFDVGNGLLLRLDELNRENATVLERLALRMDLGEFGVTLGKARSRNALELDFHLNESERSEGRGDEGGDSKLVSFFLGAKAAGLTALVLGSMKLFVIKALIIAKFALAISMVITIAKFFHHKPTYVEIEHHGSENYPVFAESPHGSTGGGYQASASSYYPSGLESALQYSTVEASLGSNGTTASGQQVASGGAAQRREYAKRKTKMPPTILTVRRYSVET